MNIKLLLLKDVPELGKKGEVIHTAKGHARNFLIPKKLAKKAGSREIEQIKQQRELIEKKAVQQLKDIDKVKEKLAKKRITIKASAAKAGKLYAAVSVQDIAKALHNTYGVQISDSSIQIEPIKTIGLHGFKIGFKDKGEIVMKVKVISD